MRTSRVTGLCPTEVDSCTVLWLTVSRGLVDNGLSMGDGERELCHQIVDSGAVRVVTTVHPLDVVLVRALNGSEGDRISCIAPTTRWSHD